MTDDPKPEVPPELRAALMEVGRLAILAGCTADEATALFKQTAAQFGWGVRRRSETGGEVQNLDRLRFRTGGASTN